MLGQPGGAHPAEQTCRVKVGPVHLCRGRAAGGTGPAARYIPDQRPGCLRPQMSQFVFGYLLFLEKGSPTGSPALASGTNGDETDPGSCATDPGPARRRLDRRAPGQTAHHFRMQVRIHPGARSCPDVDRYYHGGSSRPLPANRLRGQRRTRGNKPADRQAFLRRPARSCGSGPTLGGATQWTKRALESAAEGGRLAAAVLDVFDARALCRGASLLGYANTVR